jgi:hypothetical protein
VSRNDRGVLHSRRQVGIIQNTLRFYIEEKEGFPALKNNIAIDPRFWLGQKVVMLLLLLLLIRITLAYRREPHRACPSSISVLPSNLA